MAVTIDTVTGVNRTRTPVQRKVFYAAGRFWAFYADGAAQSVFRTSVDGTAWSGETIIGAGGTGAYISICFDGTYLHYARAPGFGCNYRRGVPNADGTITWSAAEQVVQAAGVCQDPSIAVDSNGFPWVAYSSTPVLNVWRVKNSSTNDGTWVTDNTWDLASSVSAVLGAIVALTNGKMFSVYFAKVADTRVKGKLYDGGWGGEEDASVSSVDTGEFSQDSITAIGDDVHLVFLEKTSYDITYRERTFGVGWGVEETIQAGGVEASCPVISYDTVTEDLYCFWAHVPAAEHVYYSVKNGGSWAAPVDWIDETVDGLHDRSTLTCYLSSYGGFIGVLYISDTSTPWNVRHDFLALNGGNGDGGVATRNIAAVGEPLGQLLSELTGTPIQGIASEEWLLQQIYAVLTGVPARGAPSSVETTLGKILTFRGTPSSGLASKETLIMAIAGRSGQVSAQMAYQLMYEALRP